ncbi:hypothetical protein ACQKAX_01375 [Helicobacter pylori]
MARIIEFFYSQQDRIKIRKEKKKRFNKMRYNQAILKHIEKAKEKEKDIANYGTCVALGERRRLGDASALTHESVKAPIKREVKETYNARFKAKPTWRI